MYFNQELKIWLSTQGLNHCSILQLMDSSATLINYNIILSTSHLCCALGFLLANNSDSLLPKLIRTDISILLMGFPQNFWFLDPEIVVLKQN